jgi:glycosyltransferase involved in cell wall biosynthesis
LHICFATLDYQYGKEGGGVGAVTQVLVKTFSQMGWNVSVVGLNQNYKQTSSDESFQYFTLHQGQIHYYISKIPIIGELITLTVRELERSWHLKRILEDINKIQNIDIIEFSEEAGFFLRFSSLRKNTKYIVRAHGSEYHWAKAFRTKTNQFNLYFQRLLQKAFFEFCPVIIVPSNFYLGIIKKEISPSLRQKIIKKWNPVDISIHTGLKKENLDEDICNSFLFCGRIQDVKGIDLLIKAASLLKNKYPKLSIKIAGEFHPTISRNSFYSLLKENKVENNFEILGYLENKKLLNLIKQVRCVIVPSYWESFGLVGIDTLLLNTSLIHSNVGVFKEINNIPNLLKITPGSVEELSNAMQLILKSKYHYQVNPETKELRIIKNKLSPIHNYEFYSMLNK